MFRLLTSSSFIVLKVKISIYWILIACEQPLTKSAEHADLKHVVHGRGSFSAQQSLIVSATYSNEGCILHKLPFALH